MTEYLPPPDVSRFPQLQAEHVRSVGTDVPLGRIYFADGDYPTSWNAFRWFGPTTSRFDQHPDAPPALHPDRGVMYLAPALVDSRGKVMAALRTTMLECFRDTGVVNAVADDPYFVLFKPTRPLRLLDLSDSDWITVAGGNAAISSGSRDRSRSWTRAIYDHYQGSDGLDGLLYATSNSPASRSIALWERADDALPPRPTLNEQLRHHALRASVETFAHDAGLGLIV